MPSAPPHALAATALVTAGALGVAALLSASAACTGSAPPRAPLSIQAPLAPGGQDPAAPPRAPKPRSIACGDTPCLTETQVCCGFSDERQCAPRAPLGDAPEVEARHVQAVGSCEAASKSELSLTHIALCDDSSDCDRGEVCCSQWLAGGTTLYTCIPAKAGSLACDYQERCDGDTCRTANTECNAGECRSRGAQVKCAGTVCGGAAPVCCQRELGEAPRCEASCAPQSEAEPAYEFVCSASSGCPAGASCQTGMLGSYCAGLVDGANAVVLCETTADCRKDTCEMWGLQRPPECKINDRVPGMGHCACD